MTDYNRSSYDESQSEARLLRKNERVDRMMAAIGTADPLIRRLLETIDAEYRKEF